MLQGFLCPFSVSAIKQKMGFFISLKTGNSENKGRSGEGSEVLIGFIGAGRVSSSLGIYLQKHQIPVSGYYDMTAEKAEKAARLTGTLCFRDMKELVANSRIVLIATNDTAILPVAQEAMKYSGAEDCWWGHFSGLHSSSIFDGFPALQGRGFSLHPMQSFAGGEKDLETLPNTIFTLEGAAEAVSTIKEILAPAGNLVLEISPEQKPLYHTAGVVASNYLTTLLYMGQELLKEIGIPGETALRMLGPLAKGTLENVLTLGPARALTGPIARGDGDTVKAHLAALEKMNDQQRAAYKILGQLTLTLAIKEQLTDQTKKEEIEMLLKEGAV